MKKLVIILIMSGFVLSVKAQLGYRTISDTIVVRRDDLSRYDAASDEFSTLLRPNHSILLSYLTYHYVGEGGANKSFIVKNQAKNEYRKYEGYPFSGPYSTKGKNLEKWENSYYTLVGLSSNVPYVSFLDQDFKLKFTLKNGSMQKCPTSDGGFLIVKEDSLFKLDSDLSRTWGIALGVKTHTQTPFIKEYDNYFLVTINSSAAYIFLVSKAGKVLNSFQKNDNFSLVELLPETPSRSYYFDEGLLFSGNNQIMKTNLKGEEEWSIPANLGLVTPQNEFLVRNILEQKAQFAKFNSKGQKLWETPFSEEFANIDYRLTPDGGFLTATQSNTFLRRYTAAGQKLWETKLPKSPTVFEFNPDGSVIATTSSYEGPLRKLNNQGRQEWVYPKDTVQFQYPYPQIFKKYPNGSILILYNTANSSNYNNTYPASLRFESLERRIALVTGDGQAIFDESMKAKNYFETKEKHLLFATDQYLYRLDENGSIARKTAINYTATSFSYDDDGKLLVIQRQTHAQNNDKSQFRYSLTKLSDNDAPMWTVALPLDTAKNAYSYYQKVHPNGKNGYDLVVYKVLEEQTNPLAIPVRKKDRISFLTITRPCYEKLNATINSSNTVLCADQKNKLISNIDSLGFLSYQWQRNGQTLSTSRQSTFEAISAGTYQVVVRDSVCGVSALSAPLIVKPTPDAILTPEVTGAIYAPFKAKLRANEGAGLTYQWFKEGTELTGATGAVYEAGESGNYSVRVSREGCSQLSQTLNITILQPLGVETGGTEEFKVFPNPSRGDFELNLPTGWEKAEIVLLDVMGRSVLMHRTGTHIRVEAAAGMYWLRAKLADKKISKRLIIVPF